jgi:hypothetical protein
MVKKMDTTETVPALDPHASTSASKASNPPSSLNAADAPPNPNAKFESQEEDWEDLRDIFVSPPKFPVGTTLPDRMYMEILRSGNGISKFIEAAINGFDGDMQALVEAANQISTERKNARFDTGVRSISGRISKATLTRLQAILKALKSIHGMSLAKVLGGLVQIHLSKESR